VEGLRGGIWGHEVGGRTKEEELSKNNKINRNNTADIN